MSSATCSRQGGTYHFDNLRVYVFGDDTALCRNVLEHLMQRLRLDLLAFQLRVRVVEVEDHSTLVQLLDKELWTLVGRRLYTISVRVAHRDIVCTTYP